jgi:hypothetical protein
VVVVVVVVAAAVVLAAVVVVSVLVVMVKVPEKWERAVLILVTGMAKSLMGVVVGWGGVLEMRNVGTGVVKCISV